MKTVLVAVLLFGLAPGPALAGSYTITTTAQQDADLQATADAYNAAQPSGTPALTRQQYLQRVMEPVFESYGRQIDQRLLDRAKAGEALTATELARLKKFLNLP